MLTFCYKNGIFSHFPGGKWHSFTSNKIGQVEPETAALEPLEVPVEPRAAAVGHVAAALGHVAAPVEPVVAPVDKGSSPSEAPEALFFSRGLALLPCYHRQGPRLSC